MRARCFPKPTPRMRAWKSFCSEFVSLSAPLGIIAKTSGLASGAEIRLPLDHCLQPIIVMTSMPAASAQEFSASATAEMMEMVLPNDANMLGNILGGKVMHLIDIVAATAAARHARQPVVTASVDYLEFRHPVKVGQLIILKAAVNRVFHTSMEIGVKVWSENLQNGERRHTSSAYLTFVALDGKGRPAVVAPYVPVTPQEQRRWREAELRRANRLQMKTRLAQLGEKQ